MKTAILFKKLLGAMFAVALLAGAQAAAAQDAATVANGKVLFTRLCAACHGADRSDQGRAMLPGTDALQVARFDLQPGTERFGTIGHQRTSKMPAAPMPPPMHMVTHTRLAPRRRPSIRAWPVRRWPLTP